MKTTVDLPDDLLREAKASAASQGRSFEEMIAEGLKLILRKPAGPSSPPRRANFPIIKARNPGRRLTPDTVSAAESDLMTEEAGLHARSSVL
jgi:hypothetical protein